MTLKIDVLHLKNGEFRVVGKPEDLFEIIRDELGDEVYRALQDFLDEWSEWEGSPDDGEDE